MLSALLLQKTVDLTLAAVEFAHKFRLYRYGPESKGNNVNAHKFRLLMYGPDLKAGVSVNAHKLRLLMYGPESGRICKRSQIASSQLWTLKRAYL